MSEFRDLQAKLEKIDESYFSRLAAAADDLALHNQRMPVDELVALVNSELGDQAAQYIGDKLAKGGRIEENEYSDEELGIDRDEEFFFDDIIDDIKNRGLTTANEIRQWLVNNIVGGEDPSIFKQVMFLLGIKHDHEADQNFDTWIGQYPGENIEESEESQMPDLSRYMVYIDRPDVDYIMYHIGRSRAEEGEPRFLKVDKATGDWQTQVWKRNNEPAIQQGRGTGPHRVEEDSNIHEEDSINDQIRSLLHQGKKVISKAAGAIGEVVDIDDRGLSTIQHPPETRRGRSVANFDSFDNLEIIGNVDHYDIVQHWNDNEIDEEVVEVPAGLRGEDQENLEQGGATSRDAERFLADLGPDDSVDTEVVDPETGELLDWPTKDTRRDQDDAEYQAQMDREEKEERQGLFKTPYIPTGDGDMERALEGLGTLRWDRKITDYYDITWKSMEDMVDNPEQYYEGDYDVSYDMPASIERTDGDKLNDEDHQNFLRLNKLFRTATYNIGVNYSGKSNNGRVAYFYPSFY